MRPVLVTAATNAPKSNNCFQKLEPLFFYVVPSREALLPMTYASSASASAAAAAAAAVATAASSPLLLPVLLNILLLVPLLLPLLRRFFFCCLCFSVFCRPRSGCPARSPLLTSSVDGSAPNGYLTRWLGVEVLTGKHRSVLGWVYSTCALLHLHSRSCCFFLAATHHMSNVKLT